MTRIDLVTSLAHESEYAEASGDAPTVPRVIAYEIHDGECRSVLDVFQKGDSITLDAFLRFVAETAHMITNSVTVNGECPDALTTTEALECCF